MKFQQTTHKVISSGTTLYCMAVACACFVFGFASLSFAQDGPNSAAAKKAADTATTASLLPAKINAFEKDETDRAIDKAIDYLVGQQKSNGAIFDRGHDTTMTSLSIMAMASVGIQPVDPSPQGKAMNKALTFVLQADRMNEQGYFGRKDGSRMYGHGITTLMLTEMHGMGSSDEQDELIHDRCQKGIDLILSSQKEKKRDIQYRGGWRYEPNSSDADLSVSVWQLMALRSAKNDGLQVPASAIREAVEYLKRSYALPLDPNGLPDAKPSGFSYEPQQRNPTFTMTAAGLLAMQVCGEYNSPLVKGAAEWLSKKEIKWNERFGSYGIYYYAQGMYQRGGELASNAEKKVADILLKHQNGNGSWTSGNGSESNIGNVYGTSMAVLSLSVKYHYLPIYQK